jgi:hypothetical protein
VRIVCVCVCVCVCACVCVCGCGCGWVCVCVCVWVWILKLVGYLCAFNNISIPCITIKSCLIQSALVDPAANHNAAIGMASQRGHLSVVNRLLKDKRVDPAAIDNISLKLVVHQGHTNITKSLLNDPRVDPTALHRRLPVQSPIAIPATPDTDMLHLLSHTVPLPFPAGSCIHGSR